MQTPDETPRLSTETDAQVLARRINAKHEADNTEGPTHNPEGTTPLEDRFFTASAGAKPTPEQIEAVAALRRQVVNLASHIEALVPAGRNKSLALTALEDVQMRANRGIFATGPSK